MLTWINGWLYCQICQAYMRRKGREEAQSYPAAAAAAYEAQRAILALLESRRVTDAVKAAEEVCK